MNIPSQRTRSPRPRWWGRVLGAIGGRVLAAILGLFVVVVLWASGVSFGAILLVLIAGFIAGPALGFVFPRVMASIFDQASIGGTPLSDWLFDIFD